MPHRVRVLLMWPHNGATGLIGIFKHILSSRYIVTIIFIAEASAPQGIAVVEGTQPERGN